jgi:hypothetical protein
MAATISVVLNAIRCTLHAISAACHGHLNRFLLYSIAIIGNNTRQMPGPNMKKSLSHTYQREGEDIAAVDQNNL